MSAIAVASTSENQFAPLTAAEIDETLFMYRPDARFVTRADYSDRVLHATFGSFEYPYGARPVTHFTREQGVVFLSQAAYLLAFRMAAEGALDPVTALALRSRCETEEAVFTRIDLRFRSMFENRPGIGIRIQADRVRRHPGSVVLSMSFEFEGGKSRGTCHGWIRT